MMGRGTVGTSMSGTPAPEKDHQSEVAEGKALYERFKNKEVTCKDLKDEGFSLLGEYFMEEHTGSPEAHDRMDNMLTAMAGEEGEHNIHVWWGKRGTICIEGDDPSTVFGKGGGGIMGFGKMGGWGEANYGMMGGGAGGWHAFLWIAISIVVFIDLILFGVWLAKQIKK